MPFLAYTVSLDGVVKYVGITTLSVKRRWKGHRHSSGCTRLARAIKKYGADAFVVEAVASARCVEDLRDLERILINQYHTRSPHGYNLLSGGNRDITHASETKLKISAANKGKKMSAEAKAKISLSKMGKKRSEDVHIRIAERNRARSLDPAWREKQRIGATGHHPSEETRARMSAALKGKKKPPRSAEHKAKIGAFNRGRKASEETKAKMRMAHLGRKRSPESIAKSAAAQRGRSVGDKQRQAVAEANRRRIVSKETRLKMRLAHLGHRQKPNALNQLSLNLQPAPVSGGPR